MHAGLDAPLDVALELERRAAYLFDSDDKREAMRAFLERRKPSFFRHLTNSGCTSQRYRARLMTSFRTDVRLQKNAPDLRSQRVPEETQMRTESPGIDVPPCVRKREPEVLKVDGIQLSFGGVKSVERRERGQLAPGRLRP